MQITNQTPSAIILETPPQAFQRPYHPTLWAHHTSRAVPILDLVETGIETFCEIIRVHRNSMVRKFRLEKVLGRSASELEKLPQGRFPAPVRLPVSDKSTPSPCTYLAHLSTGHAVSPRPSWRESTGEWESGINFSLFFYPELYSYHVFDRLAVPRLLPDIWRFKVSTACQVAW